MGDWVLPIFPLDSNAITVSTTVWVGVLICVAFNLRLGWTLSGLVVPGYLVPLLISKPFSAFVIVAEAIITYFIALAISEFPRKLPYWSSFFGRDRFFVILIFSVVVRTVFDGFLLNWVGEFFVREFDFKAIYQDDLHSFGLIVVALIANYFWKPGVLRGLPPVILCVGLTYAVIQFVLVPTTNFDIGTIHSMYEDITTSLLSSPKAYIILIITAYVASLVNLRYAWDFNGILIPALLGLLWHDPTKIAISAVECVLILCFASLLLKAPVFKRMTIQGASKTLFFFTVCYAYRMLACHLMPKFLPDVQMSDFFGFGYLLTTLMAIKIHDKSHTIRMLRGTVEISLVGAVSGSLVGFLFFLSSGPVSEAKSHSNSVVEAVPVSSPNQLALPDASINQLVLHDKVLIYEKQLLGQYKQPEHEQMWSFANCLAQLVRNDPTDQDALAAVAKEFAACNYELSLVADRYLYLRERSPANGYGIYVIDTHRHDGLSIEIPAPLNEPGTIETGLLLLQKMNVQTLAIAGAPRWMDYGAASDVTKSRQTIFRVFHDLFASRQAIQLRGYAKESIGRIAKAERISEDRVAEEARVYIQGSIPDSMNLSLLSRAIGEYRTLWHLSPLMNELSKSTSDCFVEVMLPSETCHELRVKLAQEFGTVDDVLENSDSFSRWLGGVKDRIAKLGSNAYVPPTIQQLLYLDREVLSPLIHVLAEAPAQGNLKYWSSESFRNQLIPINESARVMGYRLTLINDIDQEEPLVALCEIESESPKGWGTYVFRPGFQSSFAVEVTRPLLEQCSFEFGANLFCYPKCSVLLIAGAHPMANADGSADISKAANRSNLFNLVRHVLLRNIAERPLLIVQSRAIDAPVTADVVIATDDGTANLQQLTPLKSLLVKHLSKDLKVDFVEGQAKAAGYELSILMQAMSVQISQNKEVISLWLSPWLRKRFRDQSANTALQSKLDACQIPWVEGGLVSHLIKRFDVWCDKISPTHLPADLQSKINAFAITTDVVQLRSIKENYPDWDFSVIVDGVGGHTFLLCAQSPKDFPAIANLTGSINERTQKIEDVDADSVRRFVRSRTKWLQAKLPNASELKTFGESE